MTNDQVVNDQGISNYQTRITWRLVIDNWKLVIPWSLGFEFWSFSYHTFLMIPKLILASASPQRKTLLEGLGMKFDVVVSSVDESSHPESDPAKRALVLAKMKAQDVASQKPNCFVIGCDTLVVTNKGKLLEKPADASEARMMLALQSGAVSVVHSALCVIGPDGKSAEGVSSSDVHFKKLSEKEMDWWIGTKLWQGRSGAFQIDGSGQLMIERIEGDWTGVVGLPVFLLGELLNNVEWKRVF